MLPRALYPMAGAGSAQSDESESLQADVMRFMAILGLCLMVIFALVQSLPSVSVSREEVRQQQIEMSALQVEVGELREQLKRLSMEARQQEQYRLAAESDLADRDSLAASLSTSAEQYSRQVDELKLHIEGQQASLDNERKARELEKQRLLRTIEQLGAQLATSSHSAQSSPSAQTASDSGSQTQVPEQTSTAPVVADAERSPIASETATDSASEPASDEVEGFRLRFASDAAFFKQNALGRMQVYLRTQGQGYQLSVDGKKLSLSSLPPRFQQISGNSVPERLDAVLKRQNIKGRAQWGVVMADTLIRAIDQARGDAQGGILVIGETGQVTLDQR